MNDFNLEIAALSPEQKALFDKLLKQSGLSHVKTSEISRISILKRKYADNIPLSFAQQRLWFFQQLNPDNGAYNVFSALRLKGQLKVTLLEKVFTEIVRRHETLRTTFITNSEGQPVQVIASPQPFTLPILDLREASNVEQEVERLAIAQAQCPFELTQPLLRITLLKLTATEHVLLLTMHHIISDRWSLGVFVREMKALYEAFSNERSSPLPELPIQYADWAIWQQQYLQGEVLEAQMNYWKQQLANLPVLELPTDKPRPAIATYKGAKQSFELSKALTDALKALSAKEGVTLFTLLLTVFKVLLHKYTHQNDIVVGTDIANRNRVETEGLIGFLINTLVLRTNLSENPTFRQLLNRVREVTLKAYDNQDIPFDKLVDILKPERNLSDMVPLYQVKFDLQLAQVEPLELSGLTVSPLVFDNGTAKFELRFNLLETSQGLTGLVEYSTDLFEALTITRMVKHFQNLLEVIVANPEQRLSELSFLTESERHQLMVEWNDTKVEYPQHQCIHQLFEAQAERTPNAIAVVFEDQQLTYRELNAKANQLAHYLRYLGVKPEVLVGICVERSLDMVIGLLAILKAGGAYVPLDPTYPPQRLAFILKNAQVSVLLTQASLVQAMSQHKAKIVCLDTDGQAIAQHSQENVLCDLTDQNLAYVIYTSGSTGKPKGYKTLNSVQKIYDAALENRIERSSTMVALGGGVIGDMTGFAAATWLRGINFVQVPTTLLAMVDASIGGKTGVNHPQGKNLIGAFHQPRLVLIDPEVLKTLPVREFRAGMAEVIKYGIIWDAQLFGEMEQSKRLDQMRYIKPELIDTILTRSCQAKADVVSKDEKEAGLRAILNYGHTIGHAVESLTGYRVVNHGEAVAIGMVAAGQIAVALGMWQKEETERQDALIQKAGLPTQLPPGLNVDGIVDALQLDKKVKAGKVRFILPTQIGVVQITDEVPSDTIRQVLQGMMPSE
ncbi:hypothetical protein NUACC21_20820 [Scytonema sp. NUACC21]